MTTSVMVLALLVIGAVLLIACDVAKDTPVQDSQQIQSEVLRNAFEAVRPYQPTNFPAREAINWHLRQTEQDRLYYVYMLNFQGEPVFYIVSDIRPQNVCVGITAPDWRDWGGGRNSAGAVNRSAPSLTGVYRGAESCSTFFVRDAATGSLLEISGGGFSIIASTVPLAIETDRLEAQEPEPTETEE